MNVAERVVLVGRDSFVPSQEPDFYWLGFFLFKKGYFNFNVPLGIAVLLIEGPC